MRARAGWAALAVLALVTVTARGDEARKPPPEDPDPGFLEFLGSVDRLADVNPDYLAQTDQARVARLARTKAHVAPPPPPPAPPAPSVPGVKNND
jgi:hypothetical protein